MPNHEYERWSAVEAICRRHLAADAEFDVAGFLFAQRIGWTEMIKSIRRLTECSIDEAQLRALSNDGWRRWCRTRVVTDADCAKQAIWFARHHPDNPFVVLDGGAPMFIDP